MLGAGGGRDGRGDPWEETDMVVVRGQGALNKQGSVESNLVSLLLLSPSSEVSTSPSQYSRREFSHDVSDSFMWARAVCLRPEEV